MRRNFLILMLLSLLPLAGFAVTRITVTGYGQTKYYGQSDKSVVLDYAAVPESGTLTETYEAILQAGLKMNRTGANASEAPGDYNYTLSFTAPAAVDGVFDENDVTTFTATYKVSAVTPVGQLTILPMPLSEDDVVVDDIVPQVYTGSAITPALTVKNNGKTLTLGTDYTVDWEDNVEIGTATVTLTGIGDYYTDTKVKTFTIAGGLSSAVITLDGVTDLSYTGDAQVPSTITVKVGTQTLTKDTHYTVSYTNSNTEEAANVTKYAGTVTVKVTGIPANGYTGEKTATYTISPKAVEADDIDVTLDSSNPDYSGSAVNPVITAVTAASLDATEDDYEISNASTNAGAATATLTLKRNFSGTKTVEYTIAKKAITLTAGTTATLDQTGIANNTANTYEWNYTSTKQPSVTILDGTTTVPSGNYEVTRKNGDDGNYTATVGTKKAIIKAKATGNYTFSDTELEYEIVKKAATVKVKDLSVGYGVAIAPELELTGFVNDASRATDYTSTKINRDVEYKFSDGTTDYTLATIQDAPAGTYTISISNESDLEDLSANYDMTFQTGTLKKTEAQVTVRIDNQTIEYGDAFPHTDWTVTYVSGLSGDDADNIGSFVNISGIQDNFVLESPVDGVLDVNTTGYTVKYKDGDNADNVIVKDNYLITVQTGKLIVNKKKITPAMITIADAGKYTGAAKTPAVTVSHNVYKADGTLYSPLTGNAEAYLVPTNYYTTEYDQSFDAGQRTAKISVTDDGSANYVATTDILYTAEEAAELDDVNEGDLKETVNYVEEGYNIQPLAITITADNFTGNKAWTYGTAEGNYTATAKNTITNSGDVSVEAAKITALLNGQQVEGFNGTLVVKRIVADGVGTYAEGLEPMIVDADGEKVESDYATNYTITFVKGTLEVKKGTITVKVKDASTAYGVAPTEFYLEPVSGMENESADFENIATYNHNTLTDFGYDAATMKNRGTYTLAYTGTATATNYNIVLADQATGTFTVNARPIKLKAIDKSVDYANVNNTSYFNPAVNTNYVEVLSEEGFYGFLDNDGNATSATNTLLQSVIQSISVESRNVGTNTITLTKKANTGNYDVTVVPGTLTVNSDASVVDITLNRVASGDFANEYTNTAAALIQEKNGKFVNVKFSDFSMLAEKWYPLVLPFATSVKEISRAFGYAAVDLYDGTDAEGNITFKLHMGDIEANTPFIVKVYEAQNMKDVNENYADAFKNVKIVNAMDDNSEVKVGDAAGVQFVGTYKGKTDGFRSNMYYFSTSAEYNDYYKGNDTNKTYLRPLGAYFLDNSANAETLTRGIIIEEADGTTTRISAVAADGSFVEADGWYTVGGVKLEGAPTQKGIYVRNGKKVVIK